MTEVLTGDGSQCALLVAIDGRPGGLHITRGARLNFNKTQHILVPTDQVDLSPATWRTEIPGHHHVAPAAQVEVRGFLAPPARTLVLGRFV